MTRAELGRRAELAVADFLFAHGFDVLARTLRLGRLELDVVARKEGLLVVTEVRTRGTGSYQRAFESVSWAKRARLLQAVDRLWARRGSLARGIERVRIDVASVTFAGGETRVESVPSALSR